MQQVTRKALELDTAGLKVRVKRLLQLARPGLILSGAVHGVGTRLVDDFIQHVDAVSLAQHELRAALAERFRQCGEAVVQPPA